MARRPSTGPFPVAGASLAGRRVLIVDDDRTIIAKVREALASADYTLLEAQDGPSALKALREHRPDLIVSDVEMPGMSGMEICRIVKANQGQNGFGFIPVILVTSRHEGKIEGLELGADDYLIKPFDQPELAARVKSMLRLKALQDALIEKNRELDRANKELEEKREELLLLSRTDGLTGLHNRRYFEERFHAEFARSIRYQVPLSCLLIDLDHFKRLNDTRGHAVGDQMLKAVAQVAKSSLRTVDLIARYGGEELVCLLPETGSEEARLVAERMRVAIAAVRVGIDSDAQCTASIGVATFPAPEGTEKIETAEVLLRQADDALYVAKAAGRDRVHQHGR